MHAQPLATPHRHAPIYRGANPLAGFPWKRGHELYLTYLNRHDIEAAALADEEIIATIEASLAMQGRG